MADIALRSPQFKHKEIPASGVLSSVCTVTVDGTLRYTLTKNVEASTSVNFDISELARDYLEIEYKGNFWAQYVDIVTSYNKLRRVKWSRCCSRNCNYLYR